MATRPVRSLALDLLPRAGVSLHEHRRHQLAIAGGGCFTVIAKGEAFIVPASRAIFIPAGIAHSIRNRGRTRLCGIYLAPEAVRRLPTACAVFETTPLLRELVFAAMGLPERYAPDEPAGRLVAVIIDQLRDLVPEKARRLPIPTDRRLAAIAGALIDDPADCRSLDDWARVVGASARTLLRLFQAETGLSFDEWRTQVRVSAAIAWLHEGRRVTDVALDLGYESPSAFIAMFRKQTGFSPRRYVSR